MKAMTDRDASGGGSPHQDQCLDRACNRTDVLLEEIF